MKGKHSRYTAIKLGLVIFVVLFFAFWQSLFVDSKKNAILTIQGEASQLTVIEKDVGKYEIRIHPSDNPRFSFFGSKIVAQQRFGTTVLQIYRWSKTQDYYLFMVSDEEIDVKDSLGTVFYKYVLPQNTGFVNYFAYLSGFDNVYELTVNGETYIINL
jgi:hypothetical protein